MRLAEALEQTVVGALRRMASAHGLLYDDSTTRAELIDRLAERLGDATYLAEQVRGLSPDERSVLNEARAADGELRGLLLDRDHPGAAEALAERGLLFRLFNAAGPLRGEVFSAPDELMALLPEPPRVEGPPLAEPPPQAERRASDPAFSLFCLASTLGRPTADLDTEVRQWSEEPGGWAWDARWTFLRHLGQSAGLLVHRADGVLAAAGGLPRLLDNPSALAERLWRPYVRDRAWSDLVHAGFEAGDELADTIRLRQAMVDAIGGLPEGGWFRLDAFSEWLQRTRPTLVREQLTARGLVLRESPEWSDLELRLLKYIVLGPLYWLGVVAASADGATFCRRGPTRASATEPCTWEGAAELVAPPRAQLGTLLDAERYLVLLERGRPSRYHVVQSHVAAALGSGGSLDECRRLLVRLTAGGLPAGIEERLASWRQRFGAFSVRPAVVVETRSPADLDEVIADERMRSFFHARIGPTVAEVSAADALELAAALRDSGHLPRVDAALRLAAEPRRAYAGLVDEQVLEFLLVSLLAFQAARPERLGELEGALSLLERLEHQFPPERLGQLRAAAARLAGELDAARPLAARPKKPKRRKRRAL
jgi:hypothetical protein